MKRGEHQQLIADVARDILAQTEPTELALFPAISTEYFQRPAQAQKNLSSGDGMLRCGLSETVSLLTPALLIVMTEVVVFVAAIVKDHLREEQPVTWQAHRPLSLRKRINGSQQALLRHALLSAFPTHQDLEMMVSSAFNESFLAMTREGNLEYRVFELIRWSMAKGRLEELVISALQQNRGNPQLIHMAYQLGLVPNAMRRQNPIPSWGIARDRPLDVIDQRTRQVFTTFSRLEENLPKDLCLTLQQIAYVRQLAYQRFLELKLSEAKACRLADAIAATLVSETAPKER